MVLRFSASSLARKGRVFPTSLSTSPLPVPLKTAWGCACGVEEAWAPAIAAVAPCGTFGMWGAWTPPPPRPPRAPASLGRPTMSAAKMLPATARLRLGAISARDCSVSMARGHLCATRGHAWSVLETGANALTPALSTATPATSTLPRIAVSRRSQVYRCVLTGRNPKKAPSRMFSSVGPYVCDLRTFGGDGIVFLDFDP